MSIIDFKLKSINCYFIINYNIKFNVVIPGTSGNFRN